jgi:hypothetical protein
VQNQRIGKEFLERGKNMNLDSTAEKQSVGKVCFATESTLFAMGWIICFQDRTRQDKIHLIQIAEENMAYLLTKRKVKSHGVDGSAL